MKRVNGMQEGAMAARVLDLLRGAAGQGRPVVACGFALGSSGHRADLAILDDEFIGVVVRGAADPLDDLPDLLAAHLRYFDRVALVVAPERVGELDPDMLAGVALWSVDAAGHFAEHAAGGHNLVGLSGWFDLLPTPERRALLGSFLPAGDRYDRAGPALGAAELRDAFDAAFAARHAERSATFWSNAAGRPIAPADLRRLAA